MSHIPHFPHIPWHVVWTEETQIYELLIWHIFQILVRKAQCWYRNPQRSSPAVTEDLESDLFSTEKVFIWLINLVHSKRKHAFAVLIVTLSCVDTNLDITCGITREHVCMLCKKLQTNYNQELQNTTHPGSKISSIKIITKRILVGFQSHSDGYRW